MGLVEMKLLNLGTFLKEPTTTNRRLCSCNLFLPVAFISMLFFFGGALLTHDYNQKLPIWGPTSSVQQTTQSNLCERRQVPLGSEPLPGGIVSRTSNLEMLTLSGTPSSPQRNGNAKSSKNLLAIAVGIKQKEIVDNIVKKFSSDDFVVMLFHYDGVVDKWRDLQWNENVIHISAINQTKWWFAKRFLHPDIVAEYDYIFLWDEDLDVEHFHPGRYLSIVRREGLEISQPALDVAKSEVHHQITARGRNDVHRRTYKFSGGGRCFENSTAPPCTGWVEMMAPVFSRAAWRCAWYMIQNDLIHAWGLDRKLGYCAQGDRTKNVGVVDAEYVIHKGIPTLGGITENKMNAEVPDQASQSKMPNSETVPSSGLFTSNDRLSVRYRSFVEHKIFRHRWNKAVAEDKCWADPYPQPKKTKAH